MKRMKKYFIPLLLLCLYVFSSCEKYETYADKKREEQSAISRFIAEQNIKVISESEFKANGMKTDTAKANYEFVRFERTGVYMQIVRQGCGEKIEENKSVNLLCRFMEKNIQLDTVLVRNDKPYYFSTSSGVLDASNFVDKMSVTRTGTTITASFVEGMMYQYHGSASVPAGWLVPLNYVSVGRPETAEDEISKVRLIVPHSQGTADATSNVYPCYYEITYQRE